MNLPMLLARPRAGGLAALTAAAAAGLVLMPAAAPASVTRPAAAVPAAVQPREGGPARQVLLITGTWGPGPGAVGPAGILPRARDAALGAMMRLSMAGTSYDIPIVALPYFGHGLSPRLFEPGSLLAAERGGRLPVRISYHGRVPALPGIKITRSGGGTADGYLTQVSARAFGAALSRQAVADHAHASYGTDGMFADGTTIALAGTAPSAPRPRPAFPLHTLTVKAANLAGRPDTGGQVWAINVDNLSRTPGNEILYRGVAKFSVPAGHYLALGVFAQASQDGAALLRFVVLPQFTVAGNTTVAMRETSARKITVVTPRPSVPGSTSFSLERTDASGAQAWFEFGGLPGSVMWVSPTRGKPTVGTMRVFAGQQRESPRGQGTPYEYTFGHTNSSGVIPVQRYAVSPRDLVTISERFSNPVRLPGTWSFYGILPGQGFNDPAAWFGLTGPSFVPLTVPGRLTEYAEYTGGAPTAPMEWHAGFTPTSSHQFWLDFGQVLHPGEHLTDNWGGYPPHPAANALLYSAPSVFYAPMPSALRAGNTLRLDLAPFDDSQPGHIVEPLRWPTAARQTGNYQIDQNGTKIASGRTAPVGLNNLEFYTQATLSPKPSTIRFALNLALKGSGLPLAAATSTVWTWHSAPDSTAKLPSGWTCVHNTNSYRSDRDCAVQPMMTLEYQVTGLRPDESTAPGRQAIHLTVGHVQPATGSAITTAAVSVSLDAGKTWHPARLTGSDGNYTAAFTAPAGAKVSLRTSAADAAGGGVTETITNAYQIAS